MDYKLLEKPLTVDEIKARNNEVRVVIEVDINDVMIHNYEDLLDIIEGMILADEGVLSDISMNLVGCDPDNQMVHFHVISDVEFLED